MTRLSVFFAAIAAIAISSGAFAQAPQTGGPTPAPKNARVYFIDLHDGDKFPPKFIVHFGLHGMGVAPAGSEKQNSGHHHLLIDTELPPLDQPIPNDFNHLHFGAGQTEAEVTLPPGEHTLQLMFGDKDHIPHTPPLLSPKIHVTVEEPPAPRHPSPPGAKVYFVYPRNGDYVKPTTVVRFGLINMGVAPAGVSKANTGHHHLLIDAEPPAVDQPVPNDPNHLHFGAGQTEAQVTLPLGKHTLQLVLGDENHVPHDPPVMSDVITVTVTETGQRPRQRGRRNRRYH